MPVRRALSVISDIILFVLGSLLFAIVAATIFGFRIYIVESGSMEPSLNINDIAIVDSSVGYGNISVGDIVVYDRGDVFVIHRVQSRSDEGLVTKGDANKAPDKKPVAADMLVGRMVLQIPRAGLLIKLLRKPAGAGAVMSLLAAAVIMGPLKGLKDEKDSSDEDGTPSA